MARRPRRNPLHGAALYNKMASLEAAVMGQGGNTEDLIVSAGGYAGRDIKVYQRIWDGYTRWRDQESVEAYNEVVDALRLVAGRPKRQARRARQPPTAPIWASSWVRLGDSRDWFRATPDGYMILSPGRPGEWWVGYVEQDPSQEYTFRSASVFSAQAKAERNAGFTASQRRAAGELED